MNFYVYPVKIETGYQATVQEFYRFTGGIKKRKPRLTGAGSLKQNE